MKKTQQHKNEQEDHRFDRNLRIIQGVVSVLGTAAATVMTIMEAEKAVRNRNQKKEKKAQVIRIKSKTTAKALKAPPKEMRRESPLSMRNMKKLQNAANRVLKDALKLKTQEK